MVKTVVGVFDTASEAEAAVQELVQNGFDQQSIDVSSAQMNDDGTVNTSVRHEDEDTSVGDKIGDFFRSLFNGKEEAHHYSEVARRHSVVSVYVSEEQADEVADILDECGAIDVDERANQYTNTITVGTSTVGLTDVGGPERIRENVTDRVTQYGDRANADRIQTGTFQDPVGGDLNDRISSFADTTSTINESNEDQNKPGNAAQSELTTQPGRNRSRVFDRSVEEELRLRQNRSQRNEDY